MKDSQRKEAIVKISNMQIVSNTHMYIYKEYAQNKMKYKTNNVSVSLASFRGTGSVDSCIFPACKIVRTVCARACYVVAPQSVIILKRSDS